MTALVVPAGPAALRAWLRRAPAGSLALAALVALAAGFGVAVSPLIALGAVAALALGVAIVLRPELAAYLVVGITPLVVGIDRDRVVPVLRPNEALLAFCAGALLIRLLWDLRTGARLRLRPGLVVGSLLLMAVFNSVVPLLWMGVRGTPISGDDLSYAAVLWKFLLLYAVVRASVRSEVDVRRCLWIAMTAGSVVAIVAVLQSLQLFGVDTLLNELFAPFGDTTIVNNNRGSSTLGLAAATADLMIFNLALAVGVWRRYGFRPVLVPMAALFLVGTLASGQFSAAIGLVVATVAIGLVFRRADIPLAIALAGAIATVPLWSVVSTRLAGFDRASGLPESWVGRLDNLRSYFWPKLFSENNWILGVQPSARVPSPSSLALPWVWIESGYTWLLWGGGVPLLLSFVLFVVVAVGRGWRLAAGPGLGGTLGTAVFVSVPVVAVLMLFDPHITYRGSADLLFAMFALMATVEGADPRTGPGNDRPADPPGRVPTPSRPAPHRSPVPVSGARTTTRTEVDPR